MIYKAVYTNFHAYIHLVHEKLVKIMDVGRRGNHTKVLELRINIAITIARNSTLSLRNYPLRPSLFLLYMGDLLRINIPDLTS